MYSHEKNEMSIMEFITNYPSCNLTQIIIGTHLDEDVVIMYVEKLEKIKKIVKVAESYTIASTEPLKNKIR